MENTTENVIEQVGTSTCNTWYTIMVMSNLEDKIRKLILKKKDTIENSAEFFHEVLMPSQIVTEVKSGKKTARVKKLYPGYLFLRMNVFTADGELNSDAFYFITQINGVRGFVGGNNPTQLKKHEIEQILEHIRQHEGKETPKNKLDLGQIVRILDGPFINFQGPVSDVNESTGIIKVVVSIFGRDTPVELESWQVDLVDEE
mgnify:CR=1 FL=1|tara:strand:+ start:3686 stop:4291 length:606 start_codon:yes stop_codon:yes gene_type:complete